MECGVEEVLRYAEAGGLLVLELELSWVEASWAIHEPSVLGEKPPSASYAEENCYPSLVHP